MLLSTFNNFCCHFESALAVLPLDVCGERRVLKVVEACMAKSVPVDVAEHEILFLIYQYLSQSTSCTRTVTSFKQDLVNGIQWFFSHPSLFRRKMGSLEPLCDGMEPNV
jgi:hypothetical protein